MGIIALTSPVAGTVVSAGTLANDFSIIQTVINGNLDNNNFAAGLIFDPAKLMQSGATTRQSLIWNGSAWVPAASLQSLLTATGDLIVASGANTPARVGIGANGTVLTSNGTTASWQASSTTPGARAQSSPADPTGTANTTGLMMGLAGTITPAATGNVLLLLSGNLSANPSAAGRGAKAQLRYGTGSAPANAAAITGTAAGGLVNAIYDLSSGTVNVPIALQAYISGLTVSTAYWLDVSLAAIVGDTQSLKNLSLTAVEV